MESKLQLPRLETPQTAYIRASYPCIEYLENGYIADWLKERSDQLLELAREERSGINANKLVSGAVLTAGFFLHALSPLAPVGVILGLVGYLHGCFIDANRTGSFSPLPFLRGNILDIVGTLGNAELREAVSHEANEFEQLQHYLCARERKEYEFLKTHFALITEYLSQLEALKRFHAYRWIFDCFVEYKGAIPSPEQLKAHMGNVAPDLRVDSEKLKAIADYRLNLSAQKLGGERTIEQMGEFIPMPEVPKKFLPDSELIATATTQEESHPSPQTPQNQETATTPEQLHPSPPIPQREATNTNAPSSQVLTKMPLSKRAIALIDFLKADGFKIDEVLGSQVIAVAGSQRGGKGTLAGILAYQAIQFS